MHLKSNTVCTKCVGVHISQTENKGRQGECIKKKVDVLLSNSLAASLNDKKYTFSQKLYHINSKN